MRFPADLQAKIDGVLDEVPLSQLSEASIQISKRYRREIAGDLQITSELEAKAYLAARFPATFKVAQEILTRLNNIWPEMRPESILDLGAGPGTATLAALNIWPELKPTLIERNSHLARLGKQLLKGDWQDATLQSCQTGSQDIMIASYVFNEIQNFEDMLAKYWQDTTKAFILIEPGTPQGYEIIVKARDFFLKENAFIAAPCPHHFECPLRNSERWCHFSQRVQRSQLHRLSKAASLGYEDEKFSYVVATRQSFEHPLFRTLGHPHGEKFLSIETCQNNGAFQILNSSKRYPRHKHYKKLDWGDAFYD